MSISLFYLRLSSTKPNPAIVGEVKIVHRDSDEKSKFWRPSNPDADDVAKVSIFGEARQKDWRERMRDSTLQAPSLALDGDRGIYVKFKKRCKFYSFDILMFKHRRSHYKVGYSKSL